MPATQMSEKLDTSVMEFFGGDILDYDRVGTGTAVRTYRFLHTLPETTTMREFLNKFSYQELLRTPGMGWYTAHNIQSLVEEGGLKLRDEEAEEAKRHEAQVAISLITATTVAELYKIHLTLTSGSGQQTFLIFSNRVKELFPTQQEFEQACAVIRPKPVKWKAFTRYWSQWYRP